MIKNHAFLSKATDTDAKCMIFGAIFLFSFMSIDDKLIIHKKINQMLFVYLIA